MLLPVIQMMKHPPPQETLPTACMHRGKIGTLPPQIRGTLPAPPVKCDNTLATTDCDY